MVHHHGQVGGGDQLFVYGLVDTKLELRAKM